MALTLTSEAWAQIRYDYEHSERPIDEICAEHGISSGRLRDRMRRWRWTRRRPPIPREGPPPLPGPCSGGTAAWHAPAPSGDAGAPPNPGDAAPDPSVRDAVPDHSAGDAAAIPVAPDAPIGPRLQSAVAHALSAIETTLATLGRNRMHPREMERAARALAALTRTLRELNTLLGQQPAPQDPDDHVPEDMNVFRYELARRMDAFLEARTGQAVTGGAPVET